MNSFWAKHTKISKDFACSMLILSILSRASFQRDYAGCGPNSYSATILLKKHVDPKKKFLKIYFYSSKFLTFLVTRSSIFGYPVTEIGLVTWPATQNKGRPNKGWFFANKKL
jgi:hypothetical protein